MKPQTESRIPTWVLLVAGFSVPALLIGAIPVAYELMPRDVAPMLMAKLAQAAPTPPAVPAESPGMAAFHKTIQPILENHCYDCHGNGESRAGVAFDTLTTEDQVLHDPELWFKVLKNTRAGIMPAGGNPRLSPKDQATLDNWIKFAAFGVDPNNLDPGRVTIRRLNRTEYQNTIKDLMGVNFNVDVEFPPDDTGYGFDDIGDVLTLSPMRLEKFLQAAQTIVDKSVPTVTYAMSSEYHLGNEFLSADSPSSNPKGPIGHRPGDFMDFYHAQEVSHTFHAVASGDYHLVPALMVDGTAAYDSGLCNVILKVDGKAIAEHGYVWYDCEFYNDDEYMIHLDKGDHQISFELQPQTADQRRSQTKMDFKVLTVTVKGPTDSKLWINPPGYERFFSRETPPSDAAGRREYAHEILTNFATKAFRRPVSDSLVNGLVDIAEKSYTLPGATFESGVSRAMAAVLASPRFLFHIETSSPLEPGKSFGQLDEYSLASRLSYFLWSTMPDDELFKLAASGQLRNNLNAQVQRMLADPRSEAFIDNFAGQWLQSRDLTDLPINAPEILAREGITTKQELTPDFREAIQKETTSYFGYIVHNNRSILELLESNYAFLNQTLASYYGMPDGVVTGSDFRKVDLPDGNLRGGGVLTMASTLLMTSNPTRTSPVKRGKWILENILGAPAPPPPPNIPPLDDAAKLVQDHTPTQREVLALHRQDPLCASCHDRMDPLGLALENFNALGLYRNQELGQPVDATGTLATGESFKNVLELKHILATNHREEFYRTLTEKLLTYAVGRGMEYYDVPTIDKIVDRLDHEDGHFSALLLGVIESAPFQERRPLANPLTPDAKSSTMLLSEAVPISTPTSNEPKPQ